MAEDIKTQIKNYQTAPFNSCFPLRDQTGTAGRTNRYQSGCPPGRRHSWQDLIWLHPPLPCPPSWSQGGEGDLGTW